MNKEEYKTELEVFRDDIKQLKERYKSQHRIIKKDLKLLYEVQHNSVCQGNFYHLTEGKEKMISNVIQDLEDLLK